MTEQRWTERVDIRHDAVLVSGGQSVSGVIRNASLRGLYVETAGVFPLNSWLTAHVELPQAGRGVNYTLSARVAHCEESGLGLNVDILNQSAAHALTVLVDQGESSTTAEWLGA